jgi:hypothetical protein
MQGVSRTLIGDSRPNKDDIFFEMVIAISDGKHRLSCALRAFDSHTKNQERLITYDVLLEYRT